MPLNPISRYLTRFLVLAAVVGVLVVLWVSGIMFTSSSNVTIRNDGVRLASTYTVPRWSNGPHPAVVVVHGSGRVQRQDVRKLVKKLVPRGFAVLTFDKQGVAKSTGVFTALTIENSEDRIKELASDVSAAIGFLLEQPEVDRDRIGLIGIDEAGWVMPAVAVINSNVSYYVVLAGPAVTFGEAYFYRQLTGDVPGPYDAMDIDTIADRLAGYGGPYGYDPKSTLIEVDVPSLWLFGSDDTTTPTAPSVANLEMLDDTSLFEIEVLEGSGHNLLGAISSDGSSTADLVQEWLRQHGFVEGGN